MSNQIDGPTGVADERRGLPSASTLHRIALCPGSWQLEGLCDPEPENEYAASGTLIHSVLAGEQDTSVLNDDEMWVIGQCAMIESKLKEAVFGSSVPDSIREERMWYTDPDSMSVLFSGKPDAIYFNIDDSAIPSDILVIDYKTGRGVVPLASQNIQMRALAVLTAQAKGKNPKSGIHVAIIQPRCDPQFSLAYYTPDDLRRAEREIWKVIQRATDGLPKRVPGESQCRYCRGKSVCPEARERALVVIEEIAPTMEQAENVILTLSPEEIGNLLPRFELAEAIGEAVKKHAKKMLAEGIDIPGYTLKAGATRRTITDAQRAYWLLAEVMPPEQFAACCKVSIGDLEKAVAVELEMPKRMASDWVTERLYEVIETAQNQPSLKRI